MHTNNARGIAINIPVVNKKTFWRKRQSSARKHIKNTLEIPKIIKSFLTTPTLTVA